MSVEGRSVTLHDAVGVVGNCRRRKDDGSGGLRGMMNVGVLVGIWLDSMSATGGSMSGLWRMISISDGWLPAAAAASAG